MSWVAKLREDTVSRQAIGGGMSGAAVNRCVLVDGEVVVTKHVHPDDDYVARSSGDDGRLLRLWSAGALDRMPETIDLAMIAVERDGDGWLIVMEDVGPTLASPERTLSNDELEKIMASLAAMHAVYREAHSLPRLCSLREMWGVFEWPGDVGLAAHLYESLRPPTAEVIRDIRRDPLPLIDALESCSRSLVHGDFWLRNLGVGRRVVILDWGSLTAFAPPAIDLANFVLMLGSPVAARTVASPSEVVAMYRQASPEFDEEATALSFLFVFAMCGHMLATNWQRVFDPTGATMRWWAQEIENHLETVGPPR